VLREAASTAPNVATAEGHVRRGNNDPAGPRSLWQGSCRTFNGGPWERPLIYDPSSVPAAPGWCATAI